MALSLINRYLKEREGRKARILVLTASGAASAHYMNYMNGFFTAQRLGVPIDCCVLERDSGLLQQGSDITGMCHPINTCQFSHNLCMIGDWLEKKIFTAIIIKQQFGFPMSTT